MNEAHAFGYNAGWIVGVLIVLQIGLGLMAIFGAVVYWIVKRLVRMARQGDPPPYQPPTPQPPATWSVITTKRTRREDESA